MKHDPCSCGDAEPHVIARRMSADGAIVKLWSDGAVSSGLGFTILRGVRSGRRHELALRAAWLLADEVCLYDRGELGFLARMARRAVEQKSLQPRDYLRARMAGRVVRVGGRHGAVVRTVAPSR